MSLTAEQIEARRLGIGGSDAGAVAGLSPWQSPLDVYLAKIGEALPVEDNEAMYWGRTLEDAVASAYAEREGHKIQRRNQTLVHPSIPFMRANLDRVIVGESRGPGVLEIKTAARADGWGEAGSDEVPEQYLAQVAHYMAVTGYTWARLAVLIGGRDFRVYDLPRDEDLIEALIDIERRFWADHVERRIPPEPRNLSDLRALWPRDSGASVVASPDIESAAQRLAAIKSQAKALEADAEALQETLCGAIGDASTLTAADGRVLATWKACSASRIDTKALKAAHPEICADFIVTTEQRRFLLKEKAQ